MTEPVEDKPIPTYQKVTGAVVLVLVIVIIAVWHARFPADFWPIDASRVAPNLIASVIQWAIILLAAALIWPPTRRRIHHFVDKKADSIKAHVTAAHAKAATDNAELHRKLDHIIQHHPDIPELPMTTMADLPDVPEGHHA